MVCGKKSGSSAVVQAGAQVPWSRREAGTAARGALSRQGTALLLPGERQRLTGSGAATASSPSRSPRCVDSGPPDTRRRSDEVSNRERTSAVGASSSSPSLMSASAAAMDTALARAGSVVAAGETSTTPFGVQVHMPAGGCDDMTEPCETQIPIVDAKDEFHSTRMSFNHLYGSWQCCNAQRAKLHKLE